MIPILDLKEQYKSIKEEIDAAIKRVVDSQNFILGDDVNKLESEIAAYCGTKYAIGVASGTDALILSLEALGIKDKDEVITTPFTFIATAEAISRVGAKPVFVDIDPATYNIDPALIEKAVTNRTRAIIPVHLYGQCADMDPIVAIAKKHRLKVIEDCAQAIGASYKGRRAGSMGDVGSISFFPGKNLGSYGDAGMVVTNDSGIAEKIKMLRVHGSSKRYIHSLVGTNSRLDTLQAAVVRVKLKYLDGWLEARRKNAEYYNGKLKDSPITVPAAPSYNVHTYHLYTLKVKSGLEALMEHLVASGIETRTYYPIPLHLQECYRDLGYEKGDLKESEAAAREVFSIAVYPELSKENMDYVVNKIKESLKSR